MSFKRFATLSLAVVGLASSAHAALMSDTTVISKNGEPVYLRVTTTLDGHPFVYNLPYAKQPGNTGTGGGSGTPGSPVDPVIPPVDPSDPDKPETPTQKKAFDASLSFASSVYNRNVQVPSVVVKDKVGGAVLVEGSDYTVEFGNDASVNVGSYSVSVNGINDYEGSVSLSYAITADAIGNVVLSQSEFLFDGEEHTPSVEVYSVGDVLLTPDVDFTISYSSDSRSEAGVYSININGIANYAGSSSVAYSIVSAEAKALAGSFSVIEAVTYNGAAQYPAFSYSMDGNELTPDVDYVATFSNNQNAGTATVSISGMGDYKGSDVTSFVINKAPLAVEVNSLAISFGDEVPAFSAAFSGFVGSDNEASLSSVSFACDYPATKAPGSYGISASVESSNYEVAVTPGTLTVSAKSVVVAPGAASISYGDAAPAFSLIVVAGISDVSALDGFYSFKCDYEVGSAVGDYSVEAVFSEMPVGYDVAVKGGTLSVAPRNITISADNKFITQGDVAPVFSASVDGLASCDKLSDLVFDFSCDYKVGDPAGSYAVKCNVSNLSANYSATYVDGSLEVSAAEIKELDGFFEDLGTLTYNGKPQTPSVVYVMDDKTLVEGVDFTVAFSDNVNAGVAIATITGIGAYEGSDELAFDIMPASVSVTISPVPDVEYFSPVPSFSTSNNLAGDLAAEFDAIFALSSDYSVGSPVGSYTVSGSATSDNFDVTCAPVTFNVVKRPLTISADKKTISYLDKVPALSGSHNLPKGYDGVVPTFGTSYVAGNPVGTYTVEPQMFADDNFDVTYVSADLVVQPRDLSSVALVTPIADVEATGSAITPVVSLSIPMSALGLAADMELSEGDDFTVSYSSNVEPGKARVIVTGVGNFSGTIKTSFMITAVESASVAGVDLGLSVLWASYNVGATSETDFGEYFAWGETREKASYDWGSYRYCNGNEDDLTKYCSDSNYGKGGFTDNKTVLEPSDDAASVNLGAEWRMPTAEEWTELYDQCTWYWGEKNGVEGYIIESRVNSNSIFLPAAGYMSGDASTRVGTRGRYWSSSVSSGNANASVLFDFHDMGSQVRSFERYYGYPVRAVRAK